MKKDWLEELIAATNTDKRNERQMRILEALLICLEKKGYASTSTSEIAKRAGVAEGTIFRYYKNEKRFIISSRHADINKVLLHHFSYKHSQRKYLNRSMNHMKGF